MAYQARAGDARPVVCAAVAIAGAADAAVSIPISALSPYVPAPGARSGKLR
jgi:hypothetical protein